MNQHSKLYTCKVDMHFCKRIEIVTQTVGSGMEFSASDL